jgi:CMP-N-acetylneuraminic acid synthetase
MKVLGLITARGGSKGVQRKNVRLLHGKPLLAYAAESALRSAKLARVVLSTEDEEIADIGKLCGLEVPFMRPVELASDATPTLPVIQHALKALEAEGDEFDAVCLLQPTNPLRRTIDIDNCIDLLEKTNADSVVSVLPVPAEYNPKWVYWQNSDGSIFLSTGEAQPVPRRQDLPTAFHRDGTVYVTRKDVILRQNSLYGSKIQSYEIDPRYSANIDTESDWQVVKATMSAGFSYK